MDNDHTDADFRRIVWEAEAERRGHAQAAITHYERGILTTAELAERLAKIVQELPLPV